MAEEYGAIYAERQFARRASPLRRAVKAFYLESAIREIEGPTLDFGCGAGQLLERLPPGSTGLEVNPVLVDDLRRRGLDARLYDARADEFALSAVEPGRYQSFIASHVLEHFEHAAMAIRLLAEACDRLGMERMVLVLPGWKGFLSDDTHRTFIDAAFLGSNGLDVLGNFRLTRTRSFPVDRAWVGRLFVYNETVFVWRR